MTQTHGTHSEHRLTFQSRRRNEGLVDLPAALDWLQGHWDEQREAPLRLHDGHTTDGELGGLRYSGAFQATLGWDYRQSTRATSTVLCYHPMTRGRGEVCPECSGSGAKDVTTDRYPYPMSTALEDLRRQPTREGQVPAITIVTVLAAYGFRPWDACAALAITERVLLGAIRQLHGKYKAGPVVTVAWTDKSESQQMAEEVTA